MPTIIANPNLATIAGVFFIDQRFEEYAREITESVSRECNTSLTAGLCWNDERFALGAQKFIDTLLTSETYTSYALTGFYNADYKRSYPWKKERRILFEDRIAEMKRIKEERKKKGKLSLTKPGIAGSLSETETGLAVIEREVEVVSKKSPWYRRIIGK